MHWQTHLALALGRALPLLAPLLLRRRLARGKEDPERWREKLGEASATRPGGRLVWLHAVSVGEVMALRGLIGELAAAAPELEFLLTSSSRASARVIGGQLPPRTRHHYVPLDAPAYVARFLAHWRPDLAVFSEQDLWPGLVHGAARAGVPLALVNARLHDASFARRKRLYGLYRDMLVQFTLIAAQDAATARNLTALGAAGVRITGPLKAAAPALAADPAELARLRALLAGRRCWLLASGHAEDDAPALAAQAALQAVDPAHLLILAPRQPDRGTAIAAAAAALGLRATRRSLAEGPETAAVWITDTLGEMGLWYRLCPVTLVGGSFGPTEGHNPWEPAALGSAVLHGPRVANFPADYAALQAAEAARQVSAATLPAALQADPAAYAGRALALVGAARAGLPALAQDLLACLRTRA